MWVWYVVVATVVGFVAFSLCITRANRRILERFLVTFQGRPTRERDDWFNEEFAVLGLPVDEVVAVLSPVAATLRCDVTQLSSSDSFNGSLRWDGVTFLGIDDDNPWDEFTDGTLPVLCGDDEKATDVVKRIQHNPTLAELVKAVASVRVAASE